MLKNRPALGRPQLPQGATVHNRSVRSQPATAAGAAATGFTDPPEINATSPPKGPCGFQTAPESLSTDAAALHRDGADKSQNPSPPHPSPTGRPEPLKNA